MEFHVEDHPDPLDIEFLETQIRREASAAMGLGDEVDLAIFVRDGGRIVAGISGLDLGRLLRAAEPLGRSRVCAVAASRPGSSPPPKPRRRHAGARRPSTSPTTSRPGGSTSGTATNWWAGRGLPVRNGRPLVPQALGRPEP